MSDLKKGWSYTSLDQLLNFVIGGDWGKEPEYNDNDFIDVRCIRGSEFRHWHTEKGKTSVLRKVKKSSVEKRALQQGDILVEISGGGPDQPVGRTVLIDKQAMAFSQDMPVICTNFLRLARPVALVNPAFLSYYLRFFYMTGEIVKYQSGSNNLRNLKFKDYLKVSIPLAPLAEQKRIVEKLNEVLAQVETIKAFLDNVPKTLKRFRQSVLSAAASGKLTEKWRGGEQYSFETAELGTIAKFIDYRGRTPTKTDSGVPLITAKNIRPGFISIEPREFIADADYEQWMTRGIPNYGDVLITTEAPMGYVANVDIENRFALAQRAICLQFKSFVNSYYAAIYMQAADFQMALVENATGSTVKGIKAALLKKIIIKFPGIEEQKEIVRLVEQYFIFAETIETQVAQAQARVDNLTQSILRKAFSGELVPQDPNDEPAEQLLARIAQARKEAEALAKVTKKKSKPLSK